MPSTTEIDKYTPSYETQIPLKDIFGSEYTYLGMYGEYFCFKQFDDSYYNKSRKTDYNFMFAVFNKKTEKFIPVAKVDLARKKLTSTRWTVDFVYVHSKYRGKKLATKLYQYLITTHNMTIMSGSSQSPGGRHIWRELSKCKNVDITISTESYKRRKTKDKFVNGKYPASVNISEVVFIATKSKSEKLVRYA